MSALQDFSMKQVELRGKSGLSGAGFVCICDSYCDLGHDVCAVHTWKPIKGKHHPKY